MDEPLCGCGSTAASLVLYGDTVAVVRDGEVVSQAFSARADPGQGLRWECAVRPYGGCASPSHGVAATQACAVSAVRAFLLRVPDLHAGCEVLPLGAASGWPERPCRVRSGPAAFPAPVPGMRFVDEAWLERPRGFARSAAFVRAGFRPVQLRAVYPPHLAPARSGTKRPTCGDDYSSSWEGTGLEPEQAVLWLRPGVWPCCAARAASPRRDTPGKSFCACLAHGAVQALLARSAQRAAARELDLRPLGRRATAVGAVFVEETPAVPPLGPKRKRRRSLLGETLRRLRANRAWRQEELVRRAGFNRKSMTGDEGQPPPRRTVVVDTRHLSAAIAVARHGSFTRAARELYMAQSTLSRQVQALERDLGRDLFVRGTPSVTLTTAGKAFIPEAELVLEAVARAQAAVDSP